MKYPKIETAWTRDPDTHKAEAGLYKKKEFALINKWMITEKIDGMNVRVFWNTVTKTLDIRGRSDNAQFHPLILQMLRNEFLVHMLEGVFDNDCGEVILYGEAYGPKVQQGGKYTEVHRFRLFDVLVGDSWLEWYDIQDVAEKIGIYHVPVLHCDVDYIPTCRRALQDLVTQSEIAMIHGNHGVLAEGIVARTDPQLYMKNGQRLMWKSKFTDFENE